MITSAPEIDAVAFDMMHLPADYVPRAYDYLAALRAHDPIHRNVDGSVILTRYDDLVSVYRNPDIWSSDKKVDFKPKFGSSPLYEHHTTSVVFSDPPDHTRIRKLFQAAFTPKALAALTPRIESLIDAHSNELADRREI